MKAPTSIVLAFALLLISALVEPSVATAGQWYDGGTLHKSNLAAWRSATAANRLATAADYVTAAGNRKGYQWKSMQEIRGYAENLTVCINEIAVDPSLGSLKTSEISAACMVSMGWL